jgi:nitrate reductase delta subunit
MTAMAAFGFAARKKGPEHLEALERVKVWTRERFRIPDEAPVLVSELTCTVPGCAPLETVVAFWTETAERHHFKVYKPVQAVLLEDLPHFWIDDGRFALDGAGTDCACC